MIQEFSQSMCSLLTHGEVIPGQRDVGDYCNCVRRDVGVRMVVATEMEAAECC